MRVVVTGYGIVSPLGLGVPIFWDSLLAGVSGIHASPASLANWSPASADIPDFQAEQFLDKKRASELDRAAQMAMVAAREALTQAGYEQSGEVNWGVPVHRVGIAVGTTYGGVGSLVEGAEAIYRQGRNRVSPRLVTKSMPSGTAGVLARHYGVMGPVLTISSACASSANAIGEAAAWIAAGRADIVLVAGTESLFNPPILASLSASGALAKTGNGDPSTWSRPFDRDRQGMVMSEAAAVLILESRAHAEARGKEILAEFVGYGISNDAYHDTSPHPDGVGAALAMEQALQQAGLQPKQIGYINAHATATQAGDVAECRALRKVFADALADIPVSSTKGATGHALGAAGALESIVALLALQTSRLPVNLHCDAPDEEAPPLLVLGDVMYRSVDYVLSNSFGFGGQNACLIWKRTI